MGAGICSLITGCASLYETSLKKTLVMMMPIQNPPKNLIFLWSDVADTGYCECPAARDSSSYASILLRVVLFNMVKNRLCIWRTDLGHALLSGLSSCRSENCLTRQILARGPCHFKLAWILPVCVISVTSSSIQLSFSSRYIYVTWI